MVLAEIYDFFGEYPCFVSLLTECSLVYWPNVPLSLCSCVVPLSLCTFVPLSLCPISQWKKSNFTWEKIQFQIRTHPILHWNKSHFTFEEIPFHYGTNTISHFKKSHFTLNKCNFILEQIQFHIGIIIISHLNKYNFTLEKIPFYIVTNPISHVKKSNFTSISSPRHTHQYHDSTFTGSSATSLREVALWWDLSYSVCWLLKVLFWDEKLSFWTFWVHQDLGIDLSF